MKYKQQGKASVYDAHNVFEHCALFNQEMEDETALEFPQGFTCTFGEVKDAKEDEFPPPHLFWWLMNNIDGSTHLIGEYVGDDGDFMKRYLKAHREAFGSYLVQERRVKRNSISNVYQRWHNRAMRGLKGDLDTMQNSFEG